MTRWIATIAMIASAQMALATEIGSMTDAERAAFRAEIRDYLLENPEVLFEALEVYEQRQQLAQANADVSLIADNAAEIFDDPNSWVGGAPNGDITIVEFLDYRCGYCRRAFPEVAELVETDGNIRIIIKEFPILGEQSTLASRFAIAVRNTAGFDKYKEAHDLLMTLRGDVNEASLATLAEKLDLDLQQIQVAMRGPEVDQELNANRALAQKLGINGTPSFVVQNEMLRGFAPLDGMRAIVARQRG